MGMSQRETATSHWNGMMGIPCPCGGTMLLLGLGNCPGGQSWVVHLSLVNSMSHRVGGGVAGGISQLGLGGRQGGCCQRCSQSHWEGACWQQLCHQPFLSNEKVLPCSWEVSLALTGQSGWEEVAPVTAHLGFPFLFFFLPLEQRPGSIYQIGLAPLL